MKQPPFTTAEIKADIQHSTANN